MSLRRKGGGSFYLETEMGGGVPRRGGGVGRTGFGRVSLQFPHAVVLNVVRRRNTQMSANKRVEKGKRAQKSTSA